MISCDEAQARLRDLAQPLGEEALPVERAAGRVLSRPVVAQFDAPEAPVSAMDGYAVRDSEMGAVPVRLDLAGESFAGEAFTGVAGPGQCVRIFTGAVVPDGFDRVVIQENVVREGNVAVIAEPQTGGRNIRAAGSDFRRGETVAAAGTLLTPSALIAVAGADTARFDVFLRPRIAILATGDELAAPGEASRRQGAVPDSVSIGIAALCERAGGQVVHRARCRDDLGLLEAAAAEALALADIVVVTGGASVGERDYARTMFGEGLETVFSKVAMKPGKPVWTARSGGCWIVGLPGNPGSALVTARLFLAPLVSALGGAGFDRALNWRTARLAQGVPANGARETFMRGRAEGDSVRPVGNQESGAQAALAAADLLVRRPPDAPALEPGAEVAVLDLD